MKLLFSFILILPFMALSQLSTSTIGATDGVQNVLLGPGVTVSNINFTGASNQLGKFTATGTNLGINSGLIITTGTVLSGSSGPYGPNNSANSGVTLGRPGYTRLTQLVGGNNPTTHDAAILEFDFIPYSDEVRFKYVFGSEEYPEFVGSAFNDVFAFFISGPGISGFQNMAKIPGSGQPVTINNVNNGNPPVAASNPQYFVYNGNGNESPYNGSASYIQYDGFTKVLEAVSAVQCGETYHLVIAIADAGDGIYDSGIFLEANSLTSKVPVSVDYTMSFDAFNDGKTMAEGCVTTTVTLTRQPDDVANSLNVPITPSGTAIEGVDYSDIPASVTFPPGQTTVSFTFSAFDDGIAEGMETVNLQFDIPDPCNGSNPFVLNLQINDVQPVSVTVDSEPMLCPGDIITLTSQPAGGVGPYTFVWSTGATTQSIDVSPTNDQTYTVTITDFCLNESATASVTVDFPEFAPITLVTTPDVVEICPYVPTTLVVTPSGGAGDYTYRWTNVSGFTLDLDSILNVAPPASTSYNITVTDFCGVSADTTIFYTITSPPLLLEMSPDTLVCPGDPAQISVTATGGYGQYFYEWPHSGETTPGVTVNPYQTTTYEVIVSDECQTFTVKGKTTVNVTVPVADFFITSKTLFEDLPISFQNLTEGGISYVWEFGDGQTSTLVHPVNTYSDPGIYLITLYATNEIGCVDSISKLLNVREEYYVYVPNAFTPDNDRFNNTFFATTVNIKELNVTIYNRWGEAVFSSNEIRFAWDGTYNGTMSQDGIYTYKIRYVSNSGEEDTLIGHVALLK